MIPGDFEHVLMRKLDLVRLLNLQQDTETIHAIGSRRRETPNNSLKIQNSGTHSRRIEFAVNRMHNQLSSEIEAHRQTSGFGFAQNLGWSPSSLRFKSAQLGGGIISIQEVKVHSWHPSSAAFNGCPSLSVKVSDFSPAVIKRGLGWGETVRLGLALDVPRGQAAIAGAG